MIYALINVTNSLNIAFTFVYVSIVHGDAYCHVRALTNLLAYGASLIGGVDVAFTITTTS